MLIWPHASYLMIIHLKAQKQYEDRQPQAVQTRSSRYICLNVTRRRTTDARALLNYKLTLRVFGSGELKRREYCVDLPMLPYLMIQLKAQRQYKE